MDAGIDYRVVESSPWLLRLAYLMQRKGIRGGYYLENTARSRGWFDVLVRTTLPRGIKIDIPAYKDAYDLSRIDEYERDLVQLLASRLGGQKSPLVLLDCGADLGLFSALLVSSCSRIRKVIAFEPNRGSFPLLKHNLEMLPLLAEAKNAAVADFNGRGELSYPPHDAHDHAAFIVPAEEGTIPVTRLDELKLPKDHAVVLKIDVEGGELSVIRGALEILSSCPGFTVVFEAHRDQVKRTGIDPMEIVSLLTGLRSCHVMVAEEPRIAPDVARPFFEQYPGRIYNICVFSE